MRIVGLVGWFLVTFAAALIGSIASIRATEFYGALEVPSWAPPGSVFGPVWTVLYALMAVAAWLVWRAHGWQGARTALTLFLIQLAANALWSWLFFAWRLGLAAFIGPPVATERLSLTEGGLVRCALKTPYPVRSKRGH